MKTLCRQTFQNQGEVNNLLKLDITERFKKLKFDPCWKINSSRRVTFITGIIYKPLYKYQFAMKVKQGIQDIFSDNS
jgi:hypothetical protein